jgi:hypothetical protein
MLTSTHTTLARPLVQASFFTTSVAQGLCKPAASYSAKSMVKFQPQGDMRNSAVSRVPQNFLERNMAYNSLTMSGSSYSFATNDKYSMRASAGNRVTMSGDVSRK